MPRVLSFGESLWDIQPGRRTPGGAPLNVALRLAEFGVATSIVSRVGNDEPGRELLAHMRTGGLDTALVQIDAIEPTGSVHVDVTDNESVRYEIRAPAAWDYIEPEAALLTRAHAADAVVFGTLGARNPVSRTTALRLLEASRLRVCDVNLRPPFDDRGTVEPLLKLTDWLKLNESELKEIAGWYGAVMSQESAIEALCARYGIEAVCVTLGDQGALMYRHGCFDRHAAFTVDVIDTIGSGDAFLAAWMAALLAGSDAREAMQSACAAGAIAATAPGAAAPITPAMIEQLIGGSNQRAG